MPRQRPPFALRRRDMGTATGYVTCDSCNSQQWYEYEVSRSSEYVIACSFIIWAKQLHDQAFVDTLRLEKRLERLVNCSTAEEPQLLRMPTAFIPDSA